MSVQALTWVLDYSETGANDRLVMMSLGHHADDSGYVSLARASIAGETRLSEITVKRILDRLTATSELDECSDIDGPDWWRAIPINRRPRLFQLVLFAATRPGVHRVPPRLGGRAESKPSPSGARRGRAGGALGYTAPPLTWGDAPQTENIEQRTTTTDLTIGAANASQKKERRCDPLWEAMLDACGIRSDEITSSARGAYNAARKALADVHATADDVHQRAMNYRAMFPDAALTPSALAKQWAQCGRTVPAVARVVDPALAAVQRTRELEGRA